jgi:hypothetical protein
VLAAFLVGLGGLVVSGCIGRPPAWGPGSRPFRLTSVADEGDAARRASMRLVLDALEADAEARRGSASGLYERALQVDPTNPWAYLALARHRVEGAEPVQVLPVLDQAEALLRLEEGWVVQVEAHVAGLRGAALVAMGKSDEGLSHLLRARQLAPMVWDDGHLDAWELR